MDNFADERDYKILEGDKYTFFVLRRIIGGKCDLLLSDHDHLIVCFSQSPFPVWIWTSDDATTEHMETAYKICKEHGFLDQNHNLNVKYELAEYLIKRAASEGLNYSIKTNLFAYDCPKIVEEDKITKTDGTIHECTMDDVDLLVEFKDKFHAELNIDIKDRESYRKDSIELINQKRVFLWKDSNGNYVASCDFGINDTMASIGLVYTVPEYRRKHYAENLVYQVTKIVADLGYMPMLYTDADYTASNSCYVKIGYVLRGKLCMIGQ